MYTCKDNLTPLLYSGEKKKKNKKMLSRFLFIYSFTYLLSHCTARGSGYPYMYTLQLQFFPPPFLLLQHEYLDIVLNAIQQDLLVNLF